MTEPTAEPVDQAAGQAAERSMVADPLGFLIALEGVALMRAFAGEYDRDFLERRIERVRDFLDRRDQLGASIDVPAATAAEGYDAWAPTYDTDPNGLLGWDEEQVTALVDDMTPGTVLDAGCGTGRHLQRLLAAGWQGIGVDGSPGMLEVARTKLPTADLRLGRLEELPVESASVDLVVCTLALEHVTDLRAAYREFARVLRPGGRLVVSDTLGSFPAAQRSGMVRTRPDGSHVHIPSHPHGLDGHLAAAVAAGLVASRTELGHVGDVVGADWEPADPSGEPVANIWLLMTLDPEAANAAYAGRPYAFWIRADKPA